MILVKTGLIISGVALGLALSGCVAVNPAPQDHVTVETRPQTTVVQPTVVAPSPVVVTTP